MKPEEFLSVLCTDNDRRQWAEEEYGNMEPIEKAGLLLEALCSAQSEDAQQMAGMLLKPFFATEFPESYQGLLEELHEQLLQKLLCAVDQPTTATAKQILCEVIAAIALKLIDPDNNNQWTALPDFLAYCASSKMPNLLSVALRIFTFAPAIFDTEQMRKSSLITSLFWESLLLIADPAVRHQAVHTIGVFLEHRLEEVHAVIFKQLSDLLPPILVKIGDSIREQRDVSLLGLLLDMAATCPRFLRPRLEQVFQMCTEAVSDQDVESNWQHLALEVMLALSENAPAMVRTCAASEIGNLVSFLLQMMTNLEDDADWAQPEGKHVTAESSLNRLAIGLGGTVIWPLVQQAWPTMTNHSAWNHRYAALMAIAVISEGCRKQMKPVLDTIVAKVGGLLNDPHPRVRYAACYAVGQMATDFAPTLEMNFHDSLVLSLLSVFEDRDNPRVQAYAAAALSTFCENCPQEILVRYLDAIVTLLEGELGLRLQDMLAPDSILVLEMLVTAVSCVANTTGHAFHSDYERLMPAFKTIIAEATAKELRKLRGRAIECVAFLGFAVGPAKFLADGDEVMTLLLSLCTEDEVPDDADQAVFLFPAWGLLCKVMGKQFIPYLPLVMGHVLSKAATKPAAKFLEGQEMVPTETNGELQVLDTDINTKIAISTAQLETKAKAIALLLYLSRELGSDFGDYVEAVVQIMLPLLKFDFHVGVRSAAIQSLPYLLNCAASKGMDFLESLWLYICPELLKVFITHAEADVQAQLLATLTGCIECVGLDFVFKHTMQPVLTIVAHYMTGHIKRSDERMQARKVDYDCVVEEELQEQLAMDTALLYKVTDLIDGFFAANTVEFLPYFDEVAPLFMKLLEPSRDGPDRLRSTTVLLGMVEYCGPACVAYKELLARSCLQHLTDEDPELQQVAVIGCGTLAQHGGEEFAVTCALASAPLMEIMNNPKSRESDNIKLAVEATKALTNILKYNNSALEDMGEVLKAWLAWLPAIENRDAATHAYTYLCDLVEDQHPSILGNIPQIVTTIAVAFAAGVIEPQAEVGARMVDIVEQARLNPELVPILAQKLTREQADALDEACLAIQLGACELEPHTRSD